MEEREGKEGQDFPLASGAATAVGITTSIGGNEALIASRAAALSHPRMSLSFSFLASKFA